MAILKQVEPILESAIKVLNSVVDLKGMASAKKAAAPPPPPPPPPPPVAP